MITTNNQLSTNLVLRGRILTEKDLCIIRDIIDLYWSAGRSFISREVCSSLGWYQLNGRLKDRACRDILRQLESHGMIKLPPSKQKKTLSPKPQTPNVEKLKKEIANFENLSITNCDWTNVTIEMVRWGPKDSLWNSLVASYHYQGYSLIVGRHLKYLIQLEGIPISCLGWGEAAWHLKDRDNWIGWDDDARRRNLPRVINNVRFLILPWVRVHNFASSALSRILRIVRLDWEHYYGLSPLLAETFVETDRFRGTCYKASNWTYIGTTKGFRRKGYTYINHRVIKDIYVYPFAKNAITELRSL